MAITAPHARALPASATSAGSPPLALARRCDLLPPPAARRLRRCCIVLIMAVAGLSAELIAPYSPTANDFAAMTEPPSWAHLAGHRPVRPGPAVAHHLRRAHRADRRASPRRSSAASPGWCWASAAPISAAGSTSILQRVFDVVMAFPLIIMALAVVAIFGTGVHNVIVAITIPLIPRCARVVRSSALAIREMPYIDAARACGFGHARIILRHMVPNVMAPFLIMLTAFVGQAILAEASLSYLGLGVQEPIAGLGPDAAGRRRGIRLDRAVDRDLPGPRDRADRVRLQPVRRRAARRARPQAARPLRFLALTPCHCEERSDEAIRHAMRAIRNDRGLDGHASRHLIIRSGV